MANFAFAPAAITVQEGDTITWTNQDTAPHTVTTTSGPERLNSPYLSKGQSWSYTFTAPGMYMYYCTVHPDMRAEVIVQAPAPATTTAAAPAPTHASQQQQQHQQQQQQQTQNQPSHASRGNTGAMPGSTSNPHAATASSAPPATSSQTSSAAAGAQTAPSSGSGDAGQSQSQQAADSSSIRTLSPVLLLGGLTTAVAVFCLLLVGSRATGARPDPAPASPSRDANDDYDY
jgi:hypothetical protein